MSEVIPTVPQLVLDAAQHVIMLGDTHGDGGAVRSAIELATGAGTQVLLSVGDFGIGPWPCDKKSFTDVVDRWLVQHDAHLLVTPVNHENYDRLDSSPRDDAGMIVLGVRLRALPRGYRWTLGGVRFGSLGGAVSVDKMHRAEGKTWWPQERITQADIDALGDESLDILITHEVPQSVPVVGQLEVDPYIAGEADEGRQLVIEAVNRTRPAAVFSGHWHQRVTHALERADGATTRCEVLPQEGQPENAVVLDLSELDAPLVELRAWSRPADRASAL